MLHSVTLLLTLEQYADLIERAATHGLSPEAYLLDRAGLTAISSPKRRGGLDTVRRYFGSFDSGDLSFADNDRIDADLAGGN